MPHSAQQSRVLNTVCLNIVRTGWASNAKLQVSSAPVKFTNKSYVTNNANSSLYPEQVRRHGDHAGGESGAKE